MRDYRWLGVGAGFGPSDDRAAVQRFMSRLAPANELLDAHVDVRNWPRDAGVDALYLVLEQRAGPGEPDVTDLGTQDGVRTFSVAYDWLRSDFLDKGSGSWQLAGFLLLVLVTISRAAQLPLPRLPRAGADSPARSSPQR